MHPLLAPFSLTILLLAACHGSRESAARESSLALERPTGRETIVGLPCSDCDAAFEGLPAELSSSARIAPEDEPGEPLRIEGTVRDTAGEPCAGVVVYAYHTDARGIYPSDERYRGDARHHGRLRGWAQADEQGRYRFDTIRPAGYPDLTDAPAHVHMHVIEPGRCTYYIDELEFDDDPRLDALAYDAPGRGGNGLGSPVRDAQGLWLVTRDITLGERVPGYLAGR